MTGRQKTTRSAGGRLRDGSASGWGLLLAVALPCCGIEPSPNTGGTNLEGSACGRGLVVVQSDYQSTNVSIVELDGKVASSSFLSSASTDSALSAALSGDVVVPTAPLLSDEVTLIDRRPAGVLTWVDVETAAVRAQLDVRTGFLSNPQDYVSLGPRKSYVTRFATNTAAEPDALDRGGDVLIVDPAAPSITGRIDLSPSIIENPDFAPRPNRMVRAGEKIAVVVSAESSDFSQSAPSRLVLIDPVRDEIDDVIAFEGVKGCWGAAVDDANIAIPRLAIACNGGFTADGKADVSASALIIVAVQGNQLVEQHRFPAEALIGQALGFGVSFAKADQVFIVGMGDNDLEQRDLLAVVDIGTGVARTLLESTSRAFVFGEVRCPTRVVTANDDEGCNTCWVADAEDGVLRRFDTETFSPREPPLAVDNAIGLPPRYIGGLQ